MNKTEAEETVLCVPRERLALAQGLDLSVERHLAVFNEPTNRVYKKRAEAENDPSFKQLIPYVLVISAGKILRYRRGKRGGEARLHGKFSVGIGGHISERSEDATTDLHAGMLRELREEIGWDSEPPVLMGVLNDDSNPVGSVHLGIVYLLPTEDMSFVAKCKSIVDPEFVGLDVAVKEMAQYETWSAICLEHIRELLSAGLIRLLSARS